MESVSLFYFLVSLLGITQIQQITPIVFVKTQLCGASAK